MNEFQKIINIAVIAHVDAGKSTLVDALLNQSGTFKHTGEQIMDSNALEKERGITIYSKNCSIRYKDYKINIVDTPGHADFSSEVERIIRTVDTVILLVDSSEGPMPQTRFVLQKSLELGLRPILLINKIDKRDQRAAEVVDEVYELFLDLNANDDQLDFPILYGIAKQGIAKRTIEEESTNLEPLFETILQHAQPYPDYTSEPLQLQISALAYDEYLGRIGIGRIYKGSIKAAQAVSIAKNHGAVEKQSINQLFCYQGLTRTQTAYAQCGDIVLVSGVDHISIGDTICERDTVLPLPPITIEEPTLTMNFMVNTSPFAGQSGKYVTSRNIRERLERELEVNVGLRVEDTDSADCFKVSGRGELHLSILLENMRREGYEVAVSKPEVIMHYDENDKLMEPVETVIINAPKEYSGSCISKLNLRKGIMKNMDEENDFVHLEYVVPTRGLIGYRSEFINDTHGEGTFIRHFSHYEPYKGEIPLRDNGVLTSMDNGTAMTYSLFYLQERGTLFITPQTKVYEGMIVGMNNRGEDMDVNPTKNKKGTAIRSAGKDEAMILTPAKIMSLEEALEFIDEDELVELTPTDIRIRKKYLTALERKANQRKNRIKEVL